MADAAQNKEPKYTSISFTNTISTRQKLPLNTLQVAEVAKSNPHLLSRKALFSFFIFVLFGADVSS